MHPMSYCAAVILLTLNIQLGLSRPSAGDLQCVTKSSLYGYALNTTAFAVFMTDNLGSCYEKCIQDMYCSSINYCLQSKQCEKNYVTKEHLPGNFVKKDFSIYAETIQPDYGSSAQMPALSCKFIKDKNPNAQSSIYWLQPRDSLSKPFEVLCDMDTDGGGWTLVYHYHFTNFTYFSNPNNAVWPIPSWPLTVKASSLAPVSKTVPLEEGMYGAMDFDLWKKIGQEFLIKSTVNHWIACSSDTGDLFRWIAGKINCRSVKNVANVCLGYVPSRLEVVSYCGPALRSSSRTSMYFFDGSINACYPTHDPCGTSLITNHVTSNDVIPEGFLYVR